MNKNPLLGMLALNAFRGLDRPDLNPDLSIVRHDPSEHAEQQIVKFIFAAAFKSGLNFLFVKILSP